MSYYMEQWLYLKGMSEDTLTFFVKMETRPVKVGNEESFPVGGEGQFFLYSPLS